MNAPFSGVGCGVVWWGGGCHLLTCWFVQASIVRAKISCCYIEELLVYILLDTFNVFAVVVYVDCKLLWSSEASLLTGAE